MDANIGGALDLGGAHLSNPEGPALYAVRITINGGAFLNEQFRAEATSPLGAIRLPGAIITGSLSLEGAHLSNPEGPALHADSITINGGAFLNEQFRAEATSPLGAIRLPGATITGSLSLKGAHLSNPEGPALHADSITINGNAFLNEQFRAEATSPLGAIRLPGATITGSLSLKGAHLSNPEGPALHADRITINGNAFLDEQFRAEATSPLGAIRLPGATITGQLSLRKATVHNRHDDRLCLDLVGATVGGNFALSLGALGTPNQPGRVNFAGLRYPTIPWDATLAEWLTLLRERTTRYAAQPYQQLGVVHRAAGHERDARLVFIAQQKDLRRRGDLGGPLRRVLHVTSGALISYGYRPWRALAFLLAVLGLAIALVLSANAHQLTAHPKATGGGTCSLVENLGLAADIAIPLLSAGAKQRCEIITAATAGQWHLGAAYVLQVLGWAFATLFVAGYTGLVRKA